MYHITTRNIVPAELIYSSLNADVLFMRGQLRILRNETVELCLCVNYTNHCSDIIISQAYALTLSRISVFMSWLHIENSLYYIT